MSRDNSLCSLTAPGSVELDQDILVLVLCDLLEVLSDQDLDGLGVPVFGDLLAQQVLLELLGKEVLNKLEKRKK